MVASQFSSAGFTIFMISAVVLGRKGRFLSGVILLCLVVIAYWFFIGGAVGRLMCSGNDQPVPFARLSDETAIPFSKSGVQFSQFKERHDSTEYRSAIDRFPDVRSCLVRSERMKQSPNLTRFDWDKTRSTQDVEVCLFRVFSSIRSFEGSQKWFNSQGFSIETLQDRSYSVTGFEGSEEPGKQISANWPIKKCGPKFKSNIADQLLQQFFAYKLTATVWVTEDGEVRSTDIYLVTE